MTALVEGARKLVGRGSPDLPERIRGLHEAVEASRGRVEDPVLARAEGVLERATSRLALSVEHTVVALAGATGSGKSSTFNALAGLDLAAVGVRRPTTSTTMACIWSVPGQSPAELLDWLGVPRRHQVAHESPLDVGPVDHSLDGLVLLDLPDHDSTEVAHHLEVDRLVALADLIVWVLDPQKYADAAVHERYLRPMATHREIMLVVLNHIDEVPAAGRQAMVKDLERLLAEDGLRGVPVLTTSARTGEGIDDLRRVIARRVGEKRAAVERLRADVTAAARELQELTGATPAGEVRRASRAELVEAFADAAGVPTVVHAVQRATAKRAAQATGWPLTAWLGRLRPDPLRRLHLDMGERGREVTAAARASLPEPTRVQRARVDAAVRSAADDVGAQLSPTWAAAVRRASTSRLEDLNDALDKAVTGTDLGVTRTPRWWRLVRVLQVLLLLLAVAGALWLAGLAVAGYLRLPMPRTPEWQELPLPTVLLLGGVVAGLGLALLSRLLSRIGARRRARAADRRLRGAITDVADRLVLQPMDAEVDALGRAQEGLALALR